MKEPTMRITGAETTAASLQRNDSPEAVAQKDGSPVDGAEKAGLAGPVASNLAEGTVTVSERVVEAERIREIARSEPEVRTDVIQRAKADLAAGRLEADPMELADLISRDLF
tara:strand:+ start:1572 stop:1907 length:336 start_codon:yes stop_codon:yes gene_type:complete